MRARSSCRGQTAWSSYGRPDTPGPAAISNPAHLRHQLPPHAHVHVRLPVYPRRDGPLEVVLEELGVAQEAGERPVEQSPHLPQVVLDGSPGDDEPGTQSVAATEPACHGRPRPPAASLATHRTREAMARAACASLVLGFLILCPSSRTTQSHRAPCPREALQGPSPHSAVAAAASRARASRWCSTMPYVVTSTPPRERQARRPLSLSAREPSQKRWTWGEGELAAWNRQGRGTSSSASLPCDPHVVSQAAFAQLGCPVRGQAHGRHHQGARGQPGRLQPSQEGAHLHGLPQACEGATAE